jgi:hypothetical protein
MIIPVFQKLYVHVYTSRIMLYGRYSKTAKKRLKIRYLPAFNEILTGGY